MYIIKHSEKNKKGRDKHFYFYLVLFYFIYLLKVSCATSGMLKPHLETTEPDFCGMTEIFYSSGRFCHI